MTSTSPPHCHRSLLLLLLGCQPARWPVPRPLDRPVCQEGSKPSLLLAYQAASRLVHRPPNRPVCRKVCGLLPVLVRQPRCKTFFVSASVLTSASAFTSLGVSPLSHFLPCHPKSRRVRSPPHRPMCRFGKKVKQRVDQCLGNLTPLCRSTSQPLLPLVLQPAR